MRPAMNGNSIIRLLDGVAAGNTECATELNAADLQDPILWMYISDWINTNLESKIFNNPTTFMTFVTNKWIPALERPFPGTGHNLLRAVDNALFGHRATSSVLYAAQAMRGRDVEPAEKSFVTQYVQRHLLVDTFSKSRRKTFFENVHPRLGCSTSVVDAMLTDAIMSTATLFQEADAELACVVASDALLQDAVFTAKPDDRMLALERLTSKMDKLPLLAKLKKSFHSMALVVDGLIDSLRSTRHEHAALQHKTQVFHAIAWMACRPGLEDNAQLIQLLLKMARQNDMPIRLDSAIYAVKAAECNEAMIEALKAHMSSADHMAAEPKILVREINRVYKDGGNSYQAVTAMGFKLSDQHLKPIKRKSISYDLGLQ